MGDEGWNVQLGSQTGLGYLIIIIPLPPDYPGLSSSKSKQNMEIRKWEGHQWNYKKLYGTGKIKFKRHAAGENFSILF